MGLRCSFLGHTYADPEIERERDDRGDEVVVTVREVRTCTRCGTEEAVSENTEVRPVEPAPEPDDEPDPELGPETAVDADADAGTDAGGLDDEFAAPQSAEEDDGVILDDEAETEAEAEPEREPGEWPDADDTRVDEAATDDERSAEAATGDGEDATADEAATDHGASAWPDPEGEDEGFDAESDAGEGDVEMGGGGLTPEGVRNGADEDGATVGGEEFDTGIERGRSGAAPGDEVDVDAVFVCPACEYSVPVLDSSLREGDICPECQKGYLAERSPTRN